MRWFVFALLPALLFPAPAGALDGRVKRSLEKLEPNTRFHQICDIETMRRIKAAPGPLKPDRMMMDATTPAQTTGDVLSGTGGAIRSGGKWYRLSFSCRASADRMTVLDLDYRVGAPIPERDWEIYGLWK